MITGWEEFTYELNDMEQGFLVPKIVMALKRKKPGDVIKMKDMINIINKQAYIYDAKVVKVNGPRMRKIFHYIRHNKLVKGFIANSKGYFIAENKQQMKDFAESNRQRANAFLSTYKKTLEQIEEMW